MFENLVNLDVDIHKDLKFEPSADLKFAAKTPSAPIVASEIAQAVRQFPIVFSEDEPMVPVAFMSIKQEDNAFIDADGLWLGDYLPAHIRRYPFILGATDDPDKFTIMYDEGASEINTVTGKALYEENGDYSPTLQEAVDFLQAFQSELVTTQQLIRPLIEKDVLTQQTVSVTRADGSSWQFEGIRAVDAEKVKKLDDATLAEWVRSGLMAIVYAHLNSLENISVLAERQGLLNADE